MNRYRLHRLLGEGGMGSVWSATDERIRRPVAIKVLKEPPSSAQPGPRPPTEERRRLLREARAACAVRHPGIVEILDVVDEGEVPFLVMELLEGASLREHLDRVGRLDVEAACALFVQVVSAVGAAHERGVVHRDLKPDNILLLEAPAGSPAAPRIKILDFGIAKVLHRAGTTETHGLTRTGHQMGSPAYMSPEQAFGEKDIDHRTDVWSLGIVLYECLSGRLPTRADNTGQALKIITKLGIPPLERAAPHVPADLCALLGRMVAREPADRPADLQEVMGVLSRHTCVKAPAFGAPPGVSLPLDAATSTLDDAPPLHLEAPRPSRPAISGARRLRRLLAPALLTIFVASIGVGFAWRSKDVAGSAEDVRTAPLSTQTLPSETAASPTPSGGGSTTSTTSADMPSAPVTRTSAAPTTTPPSAPKLTGKTTKQAATPPIAAGSAPPLSPAPPSAPADPPPAPPAEVKAAPVTAKGAHSLDVNPFRPPPPVMVARDGAH